MGMLDNCNHFVKGNGMADEQLKKEINQYVEDNWEDIVKDISRLVAIESVEDLSTAQEGEPWGHNPWLALNEALTIASELGLDAHNCEGRIGYADLPGKSDAQIATIAHTDVVPLGTGWDSDPLTVTRKDGYLIGRGVLDDKGPAVLSLYAAKFFKDKGQELPYTLRCILGSNEETQMRDVEYYVENYPAPAFLFSPDADFPLCYGEKGALTATVISEEIHDGKLLKYHGGTADNAIAAQAYAVIEAGIDDLKPAERITFEDLGDGEVKILATGIGGHASKPAGTINAIKLLVNYLLDNDLVSDQERDFLEFQKQLLASDDGSSLGIACSDQYFTPLTCIGGTVRTVNGHFEQTVDCRFPTAITAAQVAEHVEELAHKHHATMRLDLSMDCFLTDPESEPIQVLLDTFNEVTGRNDEGFTMGGGTYARHFPSACSFGPNDPTIKHPDWVGPEHAANEGIQEKQLKDALALYILCIDRLMQLDL